MNWLEKKPNELFNTIPQEILDNLVNNKQQLQSELNILYPIQKEKLINQLMSRHILSNHHLPHFINNQESLIRWLFCLYIIE